MLIMLMVLGLAGMLTAVSFIPSSRLRRIAAFSSYALFLAAIAVLTLG